MGDNMWVAHGAWGLHWPGGGANKLPDELLEVARSTRRGGDLQAYGQAAGPALSSGRMEAMGLYASMAIGQPLNVGVDNASVIKRYAKLRREGRGRKPWGLQRDGDVWQRIEEVMQQRGTMRHRATKAK